MVRSSLLLFMTATAAAAGCVGQLGDNGDRGGGQGKAQEPSCVGTPTVEPTLVRPLNRREYENSVRDLLATQSDVTQDFPSDAIVGFDNATDALVASDLLIEKQLAAAEDISARADLTSIVPCDIVSDTGNCADDFIRTFGRKVFRRTLDESEVQGLLGVFNGATDGGRTTDQALRLVIQALLESPVFLYRVETTAGDTAGVSRVSGSELATRLSYFLWASTPDDALLDAVDQGGLDDPKVLRAQAERMLADPRAQDTTTAFHALWLKLYQLDAVTKDPTLYPDYDSLRPDFAAEAEAFTDYVFWQGGTADQYLLSNVGFADDALAAHYGLPQPGSATMTQVSYEGTERVGLLTLGSVLSTFSNPDRTSPVKRGAFIREQILCQPPPPPPPDIPPLESAGVPADATMREKLAAHETDPACSGCHTLIDPPGFGLENFDTAGSYRTEDKGKPIDASGDLLSVSIDNTSFVGARQLSERIAAAPEFYDCVSSQWFRFALGRKPGKADSCSVETVDASFADAGHSMKDLLIAIVLSDAFQNKVTEVAQ